MGDPWDDYEDDRDELTDYDDFDREEDEWVLACGYPGCCMPGYHFRSECHNADDIEQCEAEILAERNREPL
jgi:hypothetical protein